MPRASSTKQDQVERRQNKVARAIATGVVNELERKMGVDFRQHTDDHAWIKLQRMIEEERQAMQKQVAADQAQLRRGIRDALILRFFIPGLAMAFTTAVFGQSFLTKLMSWIAGHGFQ